MRNIPVWDCGDGYNRADAGSAFDGSPLAKTADYTIQALETGKCFTNAGAAGTVVLTLPTPKAGMWFKFTKIVQDQILSIKAPAGVSINGGTAAQVYKNSTTETGYATVELEAYNATNYVVRSQMGTWANAAS
jgi:hypothetical protein